MLKEDLYSLPFDVQQNYEYFFKQHVCANGSFTTFTHFYRKIKLQSLQS